MVDEEVDRLAEWSPWVTFDRATISAPMLPGVYLVRLGAAGPVVYVGRAGERSSNGRRAPQGIRGRLRRYASGRAMTSGLGEAVADRALADVGFVGEQLAEIEEGNPRRAVEWGRAALEWFDLHVRWAVGVDTSEAEQLESRCIAAHAATLWNRRRPASRPVPPDPETRRR